MDGKIKVKIGILGGTFNPIHNGHVHVARAAAAKLGLQRVIFIPAGSPPHKSTDLAPAADRLEMVRLAVADQEGFEVSDVEVRRPGRSYTIDTLEAIRARHGQENDYYFIIGADTIRDLPGWKSVNELLKRYKIVAVSRPGEALDVPPGAASNLDPQGLANLSARMLPIPGVDLSSTEIRRRLSRGESAGELVAPAVLAYIHAHGLYGARRKI